MLRFRLFGIPVQVHWFFWLVAAMLGGGLSGPMTPGKGQHLLVWVVVVFVSIMVHELGHAFMYRRFGGTPSISLYSLGGVTSAIGRYDRKQTILITAAGPAFGFALALVAILLSQGAGNAHPLARQAIGMLVWINVFWTVMNLLPVLPLDGGQILNALLGPQRLRTTVTVGMVVAGLVALWALSVGLLFVAILFGFMAFSNFQRSRGKQTNFF
ncbi:MAG: site-2 protease family protein [Verrucomicrobiales bacterium]